MGQHRVRAEVPRPRRCGALRQFHQVPDQRVRRGSPRRADRRRGAKPQCRPARRAARALEHQHRQTPGAADHPGRPAGAARHDSQPQHAAARATHRRRLPHLPIQSCRMQTVCLAPAAHCGRSTQPVPQRCSRADCGGERRRAPPDQPALRCGTRVRICRALAGDRVEGGAAGDRRSAQGRSLSCGAVSQQYFRVVTGVAIGR